MMENRYGVMNDLALDLPVADRRVADETVVVRRRRQRSHDQSQSRARLGEKDACRTTILDSSHVAMLAKPAAVAAVILEAAGLR
jgi:hypothetical protein